ncbi:XRE family transcriptional regulator [uncultured Dysosmobacter sp.]|uniref:XRE family transcriptional regulator n=1 Tax=uncultured Dysosmobacter sp. TaxID=2591384 RepID=UPI002626F864|nr:XRE family transcriptional regulator [uncultured Dysosmobacter sp.]
MAEYTRFGLEVKTKLLGPPARTQTWLAAQVSEKTGLFVDDAYLSKILTGQRNAPKIVSAICEILDLQGEAVG